MKFWTTNEIAKLRKCYPIMSRGELAQEFVPRKLSSVIEKAHQLRFRKRRDWAAIARRHVPVIFGVRA